MGNVPIFSAIAQAALSTSWLRCPSWLLALRNTIRLPFINTPLPTAPYSFPALFILELF